MGDSQALGPQSANDTVPRARMRAHQSWYRARVLGVPWGFGPRPCEKGGVESGSMLTVEDAGRGLNFLTPQLHELARRRLERRGAVEAYRLTANMLSSQPMCFNLFGYLRLHPGLATRVLRALDDDVDEVTAVELEHQPLKIAPGDGTAFDAFIAYRRRGGGHGFFAIETKLTEPFSPRAYEKAAYRQLVEHPQSPWHPEVYDQLTHRAHNQLWRNHMLAFAWRLQSDFEVGRLVVTGHPVDTGLPRAIDGYRRLLRRPDDLVVWPVDLISRLAGEAAQDQAQRSWHETFDTRYVRLDLSEDAWRDLRSARSATRRRPGDVPA